MNKGGDGIEPLPQPQRVGGVADAGDDVNLPLSPVLLLLSPEMKRVQPRMVERWPPCHRKSMIPILYADPVVRDEMAKMEEALGVPPLVWWGGGFDGVGEAP